MVNACTEAPLLSGRVCTARRTLIPFPDFKNKLDRPFFPSLPRSTEGLYGIFLIFFHYAVQLADTHVPLLSRHATHANRECRDIVIIWALLATMSRRLNRPRPMEGDWTLRAGVCGMWWSFYFKELRVSDICIPSFAVIVFVERMVELRNELNKIGKRGEKKDVRSVLKLSRESH